MTAKGSEQWIQQAASAPLTRVAIPWLGSRAHHMLLYRLRAAMTQFSVGVLPHWRHGIVIIHFGEEPAVQKEIMSDRKGESFNIAFRPEGKRWTEREKSQNRWVVLTSDSTPQRHHTGSWAVILRPVKEQWGRDTFHCFNDLQFTNIHLIS